jgi:molecular chaperone GrpE
VSDQPDAERAQEAPETTAGSDGEHEQLRKQLAAAEDRYKRALADLDNYRKRTARDLDRLATEATDRAVLAWLEVVDSVERALRMDAHGSLAQGLRAVLDQIDAVLARQGVERIGHPGETFDPERHEAIAVRETEDAEDRTVVDVTRAGYARDGRVLRPAQVTVARRPAHAEAQHAGA